VSAPYGKDLAAEWCPSAPILIAYQRSGDFLDRGTTPLMPLCLFSIPPFCEKAACALAQTDELGADCDRFAFGLWLGLMAVNEPLPKIRAKRPPCSGAVLDPSVRIRSVQVRVHTTCSPCARPAAIERLEV